ncbi:MAG: glycosyltransferase [Desulfuromonadaceae bacterium]|nr:glycosyltransferase [Desulfuromonadaceae bacterium]
MNSIKNTGENPPKVSVIIPCYNRKDFIAETINSVINQTYPNIELIVVDDGCTDGSRTLLESFGESFTILEHPGRANRGQSAAINLGIQNCTGEYVAILDSDDLFAPDKILKQVSFLMENPQIGLVYSNGHSIDENSNILFEIYGKKHTEDSNPNRVLLDCYFLLPNNSLLRRSVFEQVGGFDESLRASQDHDMAIRVSEVTKLAYLEDHLFFYRRHKDSISQKNAKRRWLNGYTILKKAYSRYNYPLSTIFGRLAVLNFRLGQCYYEEKRFLRAGLLFIASGICDPKRAIGVLIGKEKVSSPH